MGCKTGLALFFFLLARLAEVDFFPDVREFMPLLSVWFCSVYKRSQLLRNRVNLYRLNPRVNVYRDYCNGYSIKVLWVCRHNDRLRGGAFSIDRQPIFRLSSALFAYAGCLWGGPCPVPEPKARRRIPRASIEAARQHSPMLHDEARQVRAVHVLPLSR